MISRVIVLFVMFTCFLACGLNRATEGRREVRYYNSMDLLYRFWGGQEDIGNVKAIYVGNVLKTVTTKIDSLEIKDSVIYNDGQAFYVMSSPMNYAKIPRTAYLIKTVYEDVLVQYWLFCENKKLELFCLDSIKSLDTFYRRFPRKEYKYDNVVNFINESQNGKITLGPDGLESRYRYVVKRDSTMILVSDYNFSTEPTLPPSFPDRYLPNEYVVDYFTLINLEFKYPEGLNPLWLRFMGR